MSDTTRQPIKFYQTGTHTVGNRLLDEAKRTVQASMDRSNAITSGHRACQGCGEALGARYALDAAMRAFAGADSAAPGVRKSDTPRSLRAQSRGEPREACLAGRASRLSLRS